MREIKLNDDVLEDINLYIWDEVDNPIGVVQIAHGVNEHGMRYNEFAEYLNKHGFVVYCHDHVSQGKSRSEGEKTVYFGKQGVKNLKYGLYMVYERIQKDYVDLPIYAFGHSMGASIYRIIMMEQLISYNKVILNGTGQSSTKGIGIIVFFGKFLRLFGKKRPSKFFDNIFRQTQFKLKEKVEMDHFIEWLTRDKEKTAINLKDEYLYISLSVSAFINILQIFQVINKKLFIKNTDKQPKYLIMSGTHDPATNFGIDATKLQDTFQRYGISSELKLYPEGRHDTLQEINRLEVFTDIIEFLKK